MKITDAQVEAAAKALHEAEFDAETYPYANESDHSKDQYRLAARAAIAAAQAAPPSVSPTAPAWVKDEQEWQNGFEMGWQARAAAQAVGEQQASPEMEAAIQAQRDQWFAAGIKAAAAHVQAIAGKLAAEDIRALSPPASAGPHTYGCDKCGTKWTTSTGTTLPCPICAPSENEYGPPSIEELMAELVDRLAAAPDRGTDPKAWSQLLVYAPPPSVSSPAGAPSEEDVARVIARAWGSYCDLDKPDGLAYWRSNKDRHLTEARAVLALLQEPKK